VCCYDEVLTPLFICLLLPITLVADASQYAIPHSSVILFLLLSHCYWRRLEIMQPLNLTNVGIEPSSVGQAVASRPLTLSQAVQLGISILETKELYLCVALFREVP